jgi:L-lactate dehydrogenase complex protein LldG
VLLDRNSLVDNMHEAYKRIHFDDAYQYGTFMSGPSKTADIEQALVMGAQAARGLTVVMLD